MLEVQLRLEIPKTFLPLKLENLIFPVWEDRVIKEIELDYELRRKGLTLLAYSPIINNKIELSVVNINAFDFVTHGLDASVSYDKYRNPSSFNGLYKGQIKAKRDQLFATVRY